jgi:hypothetical protein
MAHAPIATRLRSSVVHHTQGVIRVGQDLSREIVQRRGQDLRELLVLGGVERGQRGERLPVFECGVPIRIEFRVRETTIQRQQQNRRGQTQCAQHERDLSFREIGMMSTEKNLDGKSRWNSLPDPRFPIIWEKWAPGARPNQAD